MGRHHNYWLVLLSVICSINASYVALEAVFRVRDQRQRSAGWSASAALGPVIWSMQFIGMLGFELPVLVSYDVPLTLLSLASAIMAAAFSFAWLSGRAVRFRGFLIGGVLAGCGIVAMHYTGMAAMKWSRRSVMDPALLALSILMQSVHRLRLCGARSRWVWRTCSPRSGKKQGAPIMGTA